MALREEFAVSGRILFRWRSYLPLAVLALVLSQMYGFVYLGNSHAYDVIWETLCFGIAAFGLAIRLYVAGHAPRGTSGRNTRSQQCESLNTTGAYSVVRHPLYLGNFFIWLGVALFPHTWWLPFMVVLLFWIYHERIMYAEEELLRTKFGQDYLSWAAKTPAFLPKFRLFEKPSLSFSMRAALRREFSGFFGVIAVFTLLELVGDWFVQRRLFLEPFWVGLFGIGLLLYLTLFFLKRRTHCLEVDGR